MTVLQRVKMFFTLQTMPAPGIFICWSGDLVDRRKFPSGVQGVVPVGDLGTGRSILEVEAVCRHCLQILAAETIGKFRTIHRLILDQYLSRWGC